MKRNKFNLSHYKLLTMNQGPLVPCGLLEVLPGDTFQMSTSALIRVQPLLRPVMHPVHVRIHHWFVPHRLVWDDWEAFITGGPDGFNASVFPTFTLGGPLSVGSLADYLGVPTGVAGLEISALPIRGYNLIWNEWYRDQDLQTALAISKASGPDSTTAAALQNVAWEKDYFTSARPWTQKGPEVSIPLVGDAPVVTNATPGVTGAQSALHFKDTAGNPFTVPAALSTTGGSELGVGGTSPGIASAAYPDNLFADLSGVSAANINDLRLAFALQRYEEARARYGSRYTEYLRYLGVRSSDARLQRPEYLGGGKQTIQFSEVLQTAPTTDGDDELGVGELKGHGIGAMRSNRFRKFFEEHGYIFSFISVKPRTMYIQGLARTWNRRTKEDFWQKELEHIGQQEVLKKEIYAQGTAADVEMWGFQDRYDEYRRQESQVAGEFRETTMDDWHMARKFSSLPGLNSAFVSSNPTNRIYADQTSAQLWVYAQHRVVARRQLSRTGTSYIF